MLDAKPTVFVSHSEKFKETVAIPFRDHLATLGVKAVLVSEMPLPDQAGSEPDAKVDYYLNSSDMFVALLTPDDELQSGAFHARPNITDEISRARGRPHLRGRLQIFKAPNVALHSNINPTYEQLDVSNVGSLFPIFERQAIEWGILPSTTSDTSGPAVGPVGPTGGETGETSSPSSTASQQRAAAVESFLKSPTTEGPQDPNQPQPAGRVHLAASVALAQSRSTAIYGVHELNGLYRERATLTATQDELSHLLRSMLTNFDSENAPGWYWFRNYSAGAMHKRVIDFALEDPNLPVRTRALYLLAEASRSIKRRQLSDLIIATMTSDEGVLRVAGLRLLESKGTIAVLDDLKTELDQTRRLRQAEVTVRAAHTPSKAVRELIDEPLLHSEEIERRLLSQAANLPATQLRRGLQSELNEIQLLSLRALNRSARLRKDDVEPLLTKAGPAIRREVVKLALRRRWRLETKLVDDVIRDAGLSFHDKSKMRLDFALSQSVAELKAAASWLSGGGWDSYAALGLAHFEAVGASVRHELETDFEGKKVEARERVAAAVRADVEGEASVDATPAEIDQLVQEGIDDFEGESDELEAFSLERFRIAALRVLTERGNQDDAAFGRRFLDCGDSEVELQSVRLLARHGSSTDVAQLVAKAVEFDGAEATETAKAALDLSDNIVDTAQRLVESEESDLILPAIGAIGESDLEDVVSVLFSLLGSKDEKVRKAAVDLLLERLDRKQRERLVESYLADRKTYYYNVVVRTDRYLYAPGWVRSI